MTAARPNAAVIERVAAVEARVEAVQSDVAEIKAAVEKLGARDGEIERGAARQLAEALDAMGARFEKMLDAQADRFTAALAKQAEQFDTLMRAAIGRIALGLMMKWGERAGWTVAGTLALSAYRSTLAPILARLLAAGGVL